MNFTPDELAARLKMEGESVQAFFQGLAPEQWDQPVYGEEGVWRVRDILAHFVAAEQGFLALIEDVAAGGSGAPEGYSIDEYNQRTVKELQQQDVLVLLGQFAMVRERTVALVSPLRLAQLENRGRHPFLGTASLGEMIRAIYHHNSLHLRDARRALRAAGASWPQPTGSGTQPAGSGVTG